MHSALNRIHQVTGFDAETLLDEVRRLTVEYKKKQALCDILEHGRKIALADAIEAERDVAVKAGEKPGRSGLTASELENRGRRSKAYRDHIAKMLKARNELAELEAEYFAARNRWDLFQVVVRFVQAEAYALRLPSSGDGEYIDEDTGEYGTSSYDANQEGMDVRYHGDPTMADLYE